MFFILIKPTTGMDPASRRYFWNLIRKASYYGITTLLSTHSMQECEALCTKIVIMTGGRIQCIGTAQHIKNKYCKELSLVIKCQRRVEDTRESFRNDIFLLQDFILKNIPNSILKGKNTNKFSFKFFLEKI